MDSTEDSLSDTDATTKRKTLEILSGLIFNEPREFWSAEDIKLVEEALEKITTGLEKAKKNVLTEEDILGVANMQMNSRAASVATSLSRENCKSELNFDSELDLDLDYEEDIDSESKNGESANGSVTPRRMTDESVVCLSSDTEPDEGFERYRQKKSRNNISRSNFARELTRENQYLKLKKFEPIVNISKLKLVYPLGVTFDSQTSSWFITDKITHTVVTINVARETRGFKITKSSLLRTPTAITILKEGSKVAVLCSEGNYKPAIRVLDIETNLISDYCSWKDIDLDFRYPARGLARSLSGNLLTTDRPPDQSPRLRIITRKQQDKTFSLEGAELPSFIASSGTTVVITDLGKKQIVLHCKLDDSDFENTKFEILRTISTDGINLKANEIVNKQYFMYVSGAQIDENGNVLIADAKNHHFKLFKPSMGFIHRVSTDFPVPYVSSFHVNEYGEILILSTRDNNIIFAELAATNRLEPHIAAASGRRPAEKSYFSKSMRKRSRDRSRDRSSDRSSDRSRESFRSMRRKLYQLS